MVVKKGCCYDKSFGDAVGHYGVKLIFQLIWLILPMLSLLNIWAGLGKWAIEGMESVHRNAIFNIVKAEVEKDDAAEEEYLDEYLDDY